MSVENSTNCRICGWPIWFDPTVRGKNGNFIPLDKGTSDVHRHRELPPQLTQKPQTGEALHEYSIGKIYLILEAMNRHIARIADALERR